MTVDDIWTRKEMLTPATKWVNLEHIMLSEMEPI